MSFARFAAVSLCSVWVEVAKHCFLVILKGLAVWINVLGPALDLDPESSESTFGLSSVLFVMPFIFAYVFLQNSSETRSKLWIYSILQSMLHLWHLPSVPILFLSNSDALRVRVPALKLCETCPFQPSSPHVRTRVLGSSHSLSFLHLSRLTLAVKQHVREIYSLFIQEEILRHPSPLQASWFCKENCLGIGNWTFMWHLQRQCIPLEEDMSPWEDTTMTSLPLIRGTTWEASVPAVFPFPEPIPQEIPQRQRSAEWGAVSSKKIPRTVRNICGKEIDRLWAGAVQHRFVRFPSIDFFLVAPCKQSI